MKRCHHLFLFLLGIMVFATSCEKDPIREDSDNPDPLPDSAFSNGVFVVNEGNFNWGNATITFINLEDNSVIQDVFKKVNGRSLGEVAEVMKVSGEKAFIVVNNSGRVEVVDVNTMKSVKTISNLPSPRDILFIDSTKAYVSDLYHDIAVLDLSTLSITGSIPVNCWTEGMIRYNDYVFVSKIGHYLLSSHNRNPKLLVIDTKTNQVIDSITTGKEPISMVMDRFSRIWVLCTGGYDHFEVPSLLMINPETRMIEKTIVFPNSATTPSRLCMNTRKDSLYFLNGGIYRMSIYDVSIPAMPFIAGDHRVLYGLEIDPETGDIFVSDAIDYVQDGFIYRYKRKDGSFVTKYRAGRIPASFCFVE